MKTKLLLVCAVVTGIYAQAQNLYGNMETWRTVAVPSPNPVILEAPVGWYDTDSVIFRSNAIYTTAQFKKQVFKTTDAHGGNYAVQVTTVQQDVFGMLPGFFTNTQPIINLATFNPNNPTGSLEFDGGTPLTQRVYNVSAWIKYLPKGNDIASIEADAVLEGQGAGGYDSVVGTGSINITHAYNIYTKLNVPIVYNNSTVIPDKLQIYITSSCNNPVDSSTLFVDDIQASTTGISEEEMKTQLVHIYPNPSNGVLHLHTTAKEKLDIVVYNATGAIVARKNFAGDSMIDISKNSTGIYSYTIFDRNGVMVQQGKLGIAN